MSYCESEKICFLLGPYYYYGRICIVKEEFLYMAHQTSQTNILETHNSGTIAATHLNLVPLHKVLFHARIHFLIY